MGERGPRLFVALVPPAPLRLEVAERSLAALGPTADRLGAVAPERIHLTLLFLGEVPPERVEPLARELETALRGLAPPALRIGPSGVFPERGRPRVFWIGAEEVGGNRLGSLHAAARRAAGAAQVEPERSPGAFRPHLTVARVRRGARPLVPEASARFGALALDRRWTPESVRLVESRLGGSSPRYVERLRVALGGDADAAK